MLSLGSKAIAVENEPHQYTDFALYSLLTYVYCLAVNFNNPAICHYLLKTVQSPFYADPSLKQSIMAPWNHLSVVLHDVEIHRQFGGINKQDYIALFPNISFKDRLQARLKTLIRSYGLSDWLNIHFSDDTFQVLAASINTRILNNFSGKQILHNLTQAARNYLDHNLDQVSDPHMGLFNLAYAIDILTSITWLLDSLTPTNSLYTPLKDLQEELWDLLVDRTTGMITSVITRATIAHIEQRLIVIAQIITAQSAVSQ